MLKGNEHGHHTTGDKIHDNNGNFEYFRFVIMANAWGGGRRGAKVFGQGQWDLRKNNQEFRDHFRCSASDNEEILSSDGIPSRSPEEIEFITTLNEEIGTVLEKIWGEPEKSIRSASPFNTLQTCKNCIEALSKHTHNYEALLEDENTDIDLHAKASIILPALVEMQTMMQLFHDLAEEGIYPTANELWYMDGIPTSSLTVENIKKMSAAANKHIGRDNPVLLELTND